ncbi:DNA directed RNA polymerase 2 [Grosmannia clavigera kw1407]|uniref:DNA directed RNA polymerase 2 n=1 Tax=Grosmannia clavigera (strain kw1407 / UAMH 11150) TaxID=655863 RepID=F0XNX3_GROCL|nr:DNA directed RNA polymerase 2 [Grosmannia clavigera kw1407]EFX00638.1 DNA directed RNA polymerase 2 [Grosmannia clavigera kw1407]
MASPQSTTSHDDSKKNLEQITFRFCAECSNMLYPKEDADAHKLQFTCRTCQYTEEAASTCVFRNVLNNAAGETAGVTQDVGSDPTVGAAFFAVDASVSSAFSAHHPSPLTTVPMCSGQAVLCLCCGTTVVCRNCGGQLYSAKPTARLAIVDGSNISSNESGSCTTESTDMTDLTDLTDLSFDGAFGCENVTALADEFEYDNDIDFYIN